MLRRPKTRIVEFANSIDPDEAAHNELPHLSPCCFLLVFEFSVGMALTKHLLKYC